MKAWLYMLFIFLAVFVFISPISAGTWIDDFKGDKLGPDWITRDRPGNPSRFEVKGGALNIVCPSNFGHMEADRQLALIKAPEGDFSVMGLFSANPEKPTDAWHGIFVLGDDPLEFACLLFGGEANQPQKALIGSMVKGTWQDKGHFPTGFDVPLFLKLEKKKDLWSGYNKKEEKEDWKQAGASWNHDFQPKWVGVGFINNWGGKSVTLIVDSFSMEGPKVIPGSSPVEPMMKLSTLWSALKAH